MENLKSLVLFFLITLPVFSVQAQSENYQLTEDFNMMIKGSSNVHDWESNIERLSGTASVSFDETGAVKINTCEVLIPVKSIKSSKGKRMDKKTMKAFNEEEYPSITYKLTSYANERSDRTTFSGQATGDLTISGVTKSVTMNVKGKLLENGCYEVSGMKDMKMTDFGIDPPTALLGTMKTKDDISIEFRVQLGKI